MPDALPPIPDWVLAAVAGGLGGAVRVLTRPEESWMRRVLTSVVGSVVAVYGTPVLAPIVATYLSSYQVPIEGVSGLVGFMLGMTGLSLCEGAITLVRRWRDRPTWPPRVE